MAGVGSSSSNHMVDEDEPTDPTHASASAAAPASPASPALQVIILVRYVAIFNHFPVFLRLGSSSLPFILPCLCGLISIESRHLFSLVFCSHSLESTTCDMMQVLAWPFITFQTYGIPRSQIQFQNEVLLKKLCGSSLHPHGTNELVRWRQARSLPEALGFHRLHVQTAQPCISSPGPANEGPSRAIAMKRPLPPTPLPIDLKSTHQLHHDNRSSTVWKMERGCAGHDDEQNRCCIMAPLAGLASA